ncbi:cytoplasmic glycerophosphodiester phosphodiesterase [Roseovarius sp. A-2]|uniref:glycerophosphodiester phosphodiesterase family protein n=1 Tax=Roseovarius sp. A-2 TaxID=1570360 RepID=UPI0009B559B7|nr:glycerophosphodiester phosphodiesterase family protein [Roseovarius sp. A-2]GAW33014.1 cytoplasmic glycerophosphodiester phosphodiesterase [Roseovarius sp. A-2]
MSGLPEGFRRVPLAHRGLHDVADGRPENSRAGVAAAIAAGYGIEIDLQLSRDGQAMVFHDYDLGRLTGESGPVRQRDAADLAAIPLKGGAEGIPDLPEILGLGAGRVPLLIELKDQHGQMGETCGTLEAATAHALSGYDGPVAVMSFNPHMVLRMAALAPDIPRGIVTCGYTRKDWPLLRAETREHLRAVADYGTSGSVFVSHDVHDLDALRLSELRGEGAAILCWTVRGAEVEARARVMADNITFEGYLPDIPA